MFRVSNIIQELGKINRFEVSSVVTSKEKKQKKESTKVFIIGFVFYFLALGLALLYHFDVCEFRTPATEYITYILQIISGLFFAWALGKENILIISSALNWKKESRDELTIEISHEETNAMILVGDISKPNYSTQELEYARFSIEKVIEKLSNKVTNFLGSNTALFSWMAIIFPFINGVFTLNKSDDIKNESLLTYIFENKFMFAFLVFMLLISLVAYKLKKRANHYSYYIKVINLALKIIETNRNSPHA